MKLIGNVFRNAEFTCSVLAISGSVLNLVHFYSYPTLILRFSYKNNYESLQSLE